MAGQFGGWTPIGAEQTASGYDVAWKMAGADQYTVWSTDSSGNYICKSIGAVSGSSSALESIETTFHQDLNGDGVIGVPAHASPATVELAGTNSEAVSFASLIAIPSGDNTRAGFDQIDLPGFNFSAVHSSHDGSTGIPGVSDATTTMDVKFPGTFPPNFKFIDHSSSGANDPASHFASTSPSDSFLTVGHDSFVFAPNFGQVTIPNFNPTTDTIQISRSIFPDIKALLGATQNDGHGNAVITDAVHDTITLQGVTPAQLLAHQGDFHIV